MATIQTAADWQKEWFEIAGATYLNTAARPAVANNLCVMGLCGAALTGSTFVRDALR
jgi:hypothetical protein